MLVRYIKEGFGHEPGTVINVMSQVAQVLTSREICEYVTITVPVSTDAAPLGQGAEGQGAEGQGAEGQGAEGQGADAKQMGIDKLKATDVSTIEYPELKELVATLGITVENQKKDTLIAAISEFKAALE